MTSSSFSELSFQSSPPTNFEYPEGHVDQVNQENRRNPSPRVATSILFHGPLNVVENHIETPRSRAFEARLQGLVKRPPGERTQRVHRFQPIQRSSVHPGNNGPIHHEVEDGYIPSTVISSQKLHHGPPRVIENYFHPQFSSGSRSRSMIGNISASGSRSESRSESRSGSGSGSESGLRKSESQ